MFNIKSRRDQQPQRPTVETVAAALREIARAAAEVHDH